MLGKLVIPFLVVVVSVRMAHAVEIETVTIGNPGNMPDTRYDPVGYGAVDYEYNIGTYEVTCAHYVDFLNAVAASDPHGLYNTSMSWSTWGCKIQRSGTSGSYTYSVTGDRANRPVNYVSWYDAARFSNWLTTGDTESGVYTFSGTATVTSILDHETAAETLGKTAWFMPTEGEWYKAGLHKNDGATGNYFDYPTSSDTVPSHDLLYPDAGNNANFFVGGYTIGGPYYTTEVGAFTNSESPYGTFDQCGNLWEWNETLITGSERGLRGGYWWNSSVSLHASDRYFNYPTHENYHIGFRVASIPETVIGDLNGDGLVSSRDLDIVRAWWGAEVEPGNTDRGDATGDGYVGSGDLDTVRGNWGVGAAAVPEPGVLFLVISGVTLLAWGRGRGRCICISLVFRKTVSRPVLTRRLVVVASLLLLAGAVESRSTMITNGDFESGNAGFVSRYPYVVPNPPEYVVGGGMYTVHTDPSEVHRVWYSFGDHTTGTGMMMIVNGAETQRDVWTQEVTLNAGDMYEFSAWGTSVYPKAPANVVFEIGGSPLGSLQLTSIVPDWREFSVTFTAQTSGTAQIVIRDSLTASSGNDFALDDISLRRIPAPLPGDLNGDGYVGSHDLDIVRSHWGGDVKPGSWIEGDPSGDGIVGSTDLDIVRANWGNTVAAAVPEPGLLLLSIGGAVLLTRVRRRHVPLVLAFFLTVPVGLGTAARADDGYKIVAWGEDYAGQVRDVPKGIEFKQVSARMRYSLAIRKDGSLIAWGSDPFGMVSDTPKDKGYRQISAGYEFCLALRSDGSIVAWGNDECGQVSGTPKGKEFTQVSAGASHGLALRKDGRIAAWGGDEYDQASRAPKGEGFRQVVAGNGHSLAIRKDGSLVAWGVDGMTGQISDIPKGKGFRQISVGRSHSLALRNDGSIVAWGEDYDGAVSKSPKGKGFRQIAAGMMHSLALREDGSIVAWGHDYNSVVSNTPKGMQFKQVSAGGGYSLALRAVGQAEPEPQE